MESDAIPKAPAPRLAWLDGVKGLAILWIVFFHFFKTYGDNRFPDALRAGYFAKFLSLCGTDSAAS